MLFNTMPSCGLEAWECDDVRTNQVPTEGLRWKSSTAVVVISWFCGRDCFSGRVSRMRSVSQSLSVGMAARSEVVVVLDLRRVSWMVEAARNPRMRRMNPKLLLPQ